MKNALDGKVVVITGASSGIGEAMARLYSKMGAKVVLGARYMQRPMKVHRSKAVTIWHRLSPQNLAFQI